MVSGMSFVNFQPVKTLVCVVATVVLVACGDGKGDEGPKQPEADTTAPVITLNGASTFALNQGGEYSEPGATAKDDVDGEVDVAITGEVDVNTLGTYTITYTAADKAGNQASITRTVIVEEARPFITRWDTTRGGVSGNTQIKIDTLGDGYNYSIEWGDGESDENVQGDIVHTYENEGIYVVRISGDFPQLYMESVTEVTDDLGFVTGISYASDNQKLVSVEQWGTIRWKSMNSAFRSTNVQFNADDNPYLFDVANMSHAFACDSNNNNSQFFTCSVPTNLNGWDVSNVNNMEGLFSHSNFNSDLSGWDVSSVTNMARMFASAGFFNQDITEWNVAQVTNMEQMFENATVFNQDLSDWNVANVTKMGYMFAKAASFNQDISQWDVSSVQDMSGMFLCERTFDCRFNQDISEWNVSSVLRMSEMFAGATGFAQNIGDWNVAKVTDMSKMFFANDTFNQDIGSWDVSSVTNMNNMFFGAKAFNQNISEWNVSKVANMSYMFASATSFNQAIGQWETTALTNTSFMFRDAEAFNQDISNWDTAKVTSMSYMFSCELVNCSFNQDLGDWNISNVADMTQMFQGNTLSIANYSNTLDDWSDLQLKQNVTLHAGNSRFNSLGRFARDRIINQFNWTIEDGGFAN